MKFLLAILILVTPLLGFAAGTASVFYPAEAAGGKITLWSSGARIFNGNGWADSPSGHVSLPLKWTDKQDRHRMLTRIWSVDLPDGRFILGAERKDEKITFTLKREGDQELILRSESFPIEKWQGTDDASKFPKAANQLSQPTQAYGLRG